MSVSIPVAERTSVPGAERTSLNFGPEVVKHGETVTLEVSPAFPFRPTFLIVDPDCASFFDIEQLRVGMNLVVLSSMAATLFLPLTSRVQLSEEERKIRDATMLDFPICQTAMSIYLKVKHRESCDWHLDCLENTVLGQACSNRPFRAALYGVAFRS